MCPQVLQSCGSPDLARSVVAPHLSKDAVDFLRGHLTPKEMTMFELLGDGWTKPRYTLTWCFAACCLLLMCNVNFTPPPPPPAEQSGPGISALLCITPDFGTVGSRL